MIPFNCLSTLLSLDYIFTMQNDERKSQFNSRTKLECQIFSIRTKQWKICECACYVISKQYLFRYNWNWKYNHHLRINFNDGGIAKCMSRIERPQEISNAASIVHMKTTIQVFNGMLVPLLSVYFILCSQNGISNFLNKNQIKQNFCLFACSDCSC